MELGDKLIITQSDHPLFLFMGEVTAVDGDSCLLEIDETRTVFVHRSQVEAYQSDN